jgi:hypothetical protein
MIYDGGVSGCNGGTPYTQLGWFIQIGRSGPLIFHETNGINKLFCDRGPIFYNNYPASGSTTYRITMRGVTSSDPVCPSEVRADYYLNGAFWDTECTDWLGGNTYEIYAERTGQDNYVSTAAGVYFRSNKVCAGGACTPSQVLTVSSSDQGGSTPNSQYKRLDPDTSSFVVCDSRLKPNPC